MDSPRETEDGGGRLVDQNREKNRGDERHNLGTLIRAKRKGQKGFGHI